MGEEKKERWIMYSSIRVPRDIHEKLKLIAVIKRKTIIETMREFVDSELKDKARKLLNKMETK